MKDKSARVKNMEKEFFYTQMESIIKAIGFRIKWTVLVHFTNPVVNPIIEVNGNRVLSMEEVYFTTTRNKK